MSTKDPETVPEELQLEPIDRQYDTDMKEESTSVKLDGFYASLTAAKHPEDGAV